MSPSGGKQWEASVDDSTLRIKLRMAKSDSPVQQPSHRATQVAAYNHSYSALARRFVWS